MRTDDPIMDFYRHDDEAEAWRRSRPVCSLCGEHIQETHALRLDGEWICERCIRENTEEIEA